jgi:phosphinothricin acetyltransferase
LRKTAVVLVRDATLTDMPALRDLYNATIPTTTHAWTETLQTLEAREAWFARQCDRGHPVLVADDDGTVVGFTAYGDFRGEGKWPGYRFTVEHTIHIDEAYWGRGIGRRLLEELMARGRAAGIHVMVAAIDSDNRESIAFHERIGFTIVARMPEVGRKFDRWLELVLMQRIIDAH